MAKRPSPLLGFNNNVKHKGKVFHIQTEDSGVRHPHVITHLFADGGRIIKSTKTSYKEHVGVHNMAQVVRNLMKEQHKAMFIALRDGQFDDKITLGQKPKPKAPGEEAKPADKPVAEPKAEPAAEEQKPSAPAQASAAEANPQPAENAPETRPEPGNAEAQAAAQEPPAATPKLPRPGTFNAVPPARADPAISESAPQASGAKQEGGAKSGPSGPSGRVDDAPVTKPEGRPKAPSVMPSSSQRPGAFRSKVVESPRFPPPPSKVIPGTGRAKPTGSCGAVNRDEESREATYSNTRPASIFEATASDRPAEPTGAFGEERISEKSLDEVILSYLAEDLDATNGE